MIKFYQIFFFILILLPVKTHAEHLVGGEISYTCLGNNEYLVTLKIYRDCFSGGAEFDFNANMTIFEGNNLYQNTSWSGFEEESIPIVATGPCFVNPPNLCLEMGIYEKVVVLPPSPQGYTIVHQRCCRGPSILNLSVPESQGNTYFIDIPPNDTECNSSPEFDELPPATICMGEALSFDHSATEADGDELVYELCTPFHGGTSLDPAPIPATPPPYTPVSWAPGFSPVDPIIADAPFTIDPETGLFEGTPTQLGQYVVGICVSEYRDGVLLCTTRRDFQINVVLCNPVMAAVPGVDPNDDGGCSGLDFQFINDSFNADEFHWDFGVDDDPSAVSDEFAPNYTYPDTGTYNVMLVANPGEVCSDTAFMEVAAYHPVSVVIDSAGFYCEDEQMWSFQCSGDFSVSGSEILWDFGDGADPADFSGHVPPPVVYESPGTKTITVSIDQTGCVDETTVDIMVETPVSAAIGEQTETCDGLTINFQNLSSNASFYEWHFGDPESDGFVTTTNPIHTYSQPGSYSVMLVAGKENACSDTAYADFAVNSFLEAHFEAPPPRCFSGHSLNFEAGGIFHSGAEFLWDFGTGATPSISTAANPQQIEFAEPGYFPVTLTITQEACEDVHTEMVRLYVDPVADFTTTAQTGCAPHEVTFNNTSISDTPLSYHWEFGDGTTSQLPSPVHTYSEPGVYTVSLKVTGLSGCMSSDEKVRTNYITVLPSPTAGFEFDPPESDILNPEVNIISTSEDAFECVYIFPDSTEITGCDLLHEFNDAGDFQVVQVVTNEVGCQDVFSGTIRILGHVFYAPNAFSPDEDGINDIFKPVMRGVSAYEMQILNRTGELLFETTDPDLGWNGEGVRGVHYMESEVYIYKARIEDMQGTPYEYQGHVTIIR